MGSGSSNPRLHNPEQNKTKQNKTKQNKTKQNKTKNKNKKTPLGPRNFTLITHENYRAIGYKEDCSTYWANT